MDAHQNARTTPHRRQLIVDRLAQGWTVNTVATALGITPYEFVCQAWTKQPERVRIDPSHHTAGPNI